MLFTNFDSYDKNLLTFDNEAKITLTFSAKTDLLTDFDTDIYRLYLLTLILGSLVIMIMISHNYNTGSTFTDFDKV